jgi:hypothetical protein
MPKRAKGADMKNIILRIFTIITLLVTVAFASALASVSAQTPGHNITANVPFEFNVGDKTLPAGSYAVAAVGTDRSGLRVSNRDDNETAIRLTQTVQANEPKEQTVLVFKRYGDRYFLSQVWLSGETKGLQMLKSKSERAMAEELAKNEAKAETVTIVASLR